MTYKIGDLVCLRHDKHCFGYIIKVNEYGIMLNSVTIKYLNIDFTGNADTYDIELL